MKNGKKPTYNQRKFIEYHGMDAHDWFVIKDTPSEMVIVHRTCGNATQTIKKG